MPLDSKNAQNDALAAWKNRKKKGTGSAGITARPESEKAPLSYGQQRLWLLDQLYPGQHLYHYAHRYQIMGPLNVHLFTESFQLLAKRHHVLRSQYATEEGHQVQKIHANAVPHNVLDLSGLDKEDQHRALHNEIDKSAKAPFDLEKDVLMRLYIYKCSNTHYEILVVMHHIIGDAWSLTILNQEISAIYQALVQGEQPQLAELKFQYKDYAQWQRKQELKETDLAFWKDQLSGDLPVNYIPGARKNNRSHKEGRVIKETLPGPLREQLEALSKKEGTTMYVLMLAIYKLLLSRYSQQQDVLVGSPFSNRDTPALEKLIGFFNETLVLRTKVDQELSFRDYLQKVKQTTLDAFTHKQVPFDSVVGLVNAERNRDENPLFQTMFLYNSPAPGLKLGSDLQVKEETLDLQVAKFDFTLFVNEVEAGLEIAFEYSLDFEEHSMAELVRNMLTLTAQVLEKPDAKLHALSLYSEGQLNELLKLWQGQKTEASSWKSVQSWIMAEARPESTAVICGDTSITYHELGELSDAVAHKLRARGISRNDFVGLYAERSVEMVAGILGILKAGAAYLPLDPDYPEERLNFMLDDAGTGTVLCEPGIDGKLDAQNLELIYIEKTDTEDISQTILEDVTAPEDNAYLIYTSGSTGKPKGVSVSHANLIHSTAARSEFFHDPMERFLLLSSFSFDSSIVGIFWSLCSGGTLVLPPKRIEQDPDRLAQIIAAHKVTHTLMLPSLYKVLLQYTEPEALVSLKAVMVAGEACPLTLKDQHFNQSPGTRLYNEYGPTEASVWCVAHEIKRQDNFMPIGRPIANTSVLILDENFDPVPTGVAGELYIGGPGVTGGYLNRPELTAERFIPNPLSDKGDILYKTGDLASYDKEGRISFLGRSDAQVKIRGFRVELEEIRNQVMLIQGVSDAVVKIHEDEEGNKQIISWLESAVEDIENTVIQCLKTQLPAYMVPSRMTALPRLPKLPNGKTDHKKLVLPEKAIRQQNQALPTTEKEKALAEIWQEVLGLDSVSVEDNFFDIGGDSILSIQIVARARQSGLSMAPTAIFEYQSIREMARHTDFTDESTSENEEVSYPIKTSLSYQQQAFLFHKLQSTQDQGLLQLEFYVNGPVDTELMQRAWHATVQAHPVLRTSFHWQDQEASYQLIEATGKTHWYFTDLSAHKNEKLAEEQGRFKAWDNAQPIDLNDTGGGRLSLVKLEESRYVLLWTTHHILVDGWSGAIVIKDLLRVYAQLAEGYTPHLERVRHFKAYSDWKLSLPEAPARLFFSEMLQGRQSPLFSDYRASGKKGVFEDLNLTLKESVVVQLKSLVQQERLTLNTLLQGIWMLTLQNFFQDEHIVLGVTVTGRSADFKGIDRTTGLLMNVLPVAEKITHDVGLSQWLRSLQETLNKLRQFEHTDLDKIQDWSGAKPNRPLFDSLFVFGNFMNEAIHEGGLTIEEFRGDFSSTFPLALRVNPVGDYEINCRYDIGIVSPEVAAFLVESYHDILGNVASSGLMDTNLEDLKFTDPQAVKAKKVRPGNERAVTGSFSSSLSHVELELLKMWEKIIGIEFIDVHDNYFELGGTSLGALRLFAEIEQRFGKKLSPTTLIQHPTIASLSKLISDVGNDTRLSSIVPMKTSGQLPPLFCLHSGGAYVLFYQGIARHLKGDRPVYAIQPTGLDGEEEYHDSIAEMAKHYISEMQKIQAHGPYHLIGTCLGNAVGIEMAHQLKAMGEELAVLYVVDSGPAYLIPPSPNGERKPVRRMLAMVADANWRGIVKKFKTRYIRLDKKIKANTRTEQEVELDEMVDSLNDVYVGYTWRPVDNKIVLIRSSEFSGRKDKQFHLDRWNFLANNELEVFEVEGHHLTLFEEPEVQGLTMAIEEHLSSL